MTAASDPFANMFGSMDMSKAVQAQGATTGPTPLDLDSLLAGGPHGPTSGPSMGFTTPSQSQLSPQGICHILTTSNRTYSQLQCLNLCKLMWQCCQLYHGDPVGPTFYPVRSLLCLGSPAHGSMLDI